MLKITSKVIEKKIKLLYNETVESLQIFSKILKIELNIYMFMPNR
jgi:hypothetical protein